MKSKITAVIAVIMLVLPWASEARTSESLVKTYGSYAPGTYSQFDVVVSDFQLVDPSAVSVLTFSDTAPSDINSVQFLASSGWTTVSLSPKGQDLTGKFLSQTGFEIGNQRTITVRADFRIARTYIVGYSIQNSSGKTIASAAAPMVVGAAKILGAVITAPSAEKSIFPAPATSSGYIFNRRLAVGISGSDVTALQNKLTQEGYYSGPITGYFGVQTKAGVIAYQKAHGIDPIGIVGPATLAALNQ